MISQKSNRKTLLKMKTYLSWIYQYHNYPIMFNN
nr:MAG TPA: hypothetical protein [Caudoviricetes sp.]